MTGTLNFNSNGVSSRSRLAKVRDEEGHCQVSVTSGDLHVAADEKDRIGKPTSAGKEFSLAEEKGRRAAN